MKTFTFNLFTFSPFFNPFRLTKKNRDAPRAAASFIVSECLLYHNHAAVDDVESLDGLLHTATGEVEPLTIGH